MIRTYKMATITAVGSAGSAEGTGTTTHPLSGLLLSIKVVQGNTPHANTDITVTCTDGQTSRTLLTLTDNNTASAWYNVREIQDDTVGADITGAYTPIPLDGYVTVAVAQGGSDATCDVSIVYDDGR
jgi:hypothetical protein